PDKADYLQGKLAWSTFCQGWLPYLPEGAAQALLERTGLRNEYVPIQPQGAQSRRCSGCGGEVSALPGAKEVVCDGCGRKLDVRTWGSRPTTGRHRLRGSLAAATLAGAGVLVVAIVLVTASGGAVSGDPTQPRGTTAGSTDLGTLGRGYGSLVDRYENAERSW